MNSSQLEASKKQTEFFMTNISQAHLIGQNMIKDSKANFELIDEYKKRIDHVRLFF